MSSIDTRETEETRRELIGSPCGAKAEAVASKAARMTNFMMRK
jgi:hypothetical protein